MTRFIDRFAELCESKRFCFLIVVVVSFLTVIMPVLIGGLHSSGDLGIYLGFAQEIRASIEQGNWFPGWANDNLGFGSVGIRFYPPISFYTSALLSFLIGDWYYVVCAYFLIWMIPGCWGIYLFLREWVSGIQSLLGGVLYAIVPFHLAEIYQFSLYAEFAAGAILPFCFLYAARICRKAEWTDVLGFAIACAALILTHIPTTLIGAISLVVFIGLLIEKRAFITKAVKLAVAALAALAASSLYWVRVVNEVNWVAHNQPYYSSGLASYAQWLFPHLLFLGNSPEYYAPTFRSFDAIIILTGGLFVPALYFMFKGQLLRGVYAKKLLRSIFVTGMFGIFMLSHASGFIWARIEVLQKIQFPWRWLTVVSVLGTLAFVMTIAAAARTGGRIRTAALLYVVVIAGLIMAYDLRKSFTRGNVVSRAEFEEVLNIKNKQAGNSFAAWWPVWAQPEALQMGERIQAGDRSVEITSWESLSRRIVIGPGDEAIATVATFYYPHWKVDLNGSELIAKPDENGLITFSMPRGPAEVAIRFEEPAINRITMIVSVATWIVLAGLAVFLWFRRKLIHVPVASRSE